MGNLAHQSPRENMHKLLDYIRTSLKGFLACLTFYRKEMRLCYLHKRTNPGSAPYFPSFRNFKINPLLVVKEYLLLFLSLIR